MRAEFYFVHVQPFPIFQPRSQIRLLHAQYLNLADRHVRQFSFYNPLQKLNDRAFAQAWKLFHRSCEECASTVSELPRSTKCISTLNCVDLFIPCQDAATRAVASLVSYLQENPQDRV